MTCALGRSAWGKAQRHDVDGSGSDEFDSSDDGIDGDDGCDDVGELHDFGGFDGLASSVHRSLSRRSDATTEEVIPLARHVVT